jgi:colanic acid biosynthesis glycosyl transferase WcaI
MFEIMASARPLILGVRGEAERLLHEAQAGLPCDPESPEQMRDAIVRLAADPELCRRLGQNGRDYAVRHASYAQRAAQYIDVLEPAPSAEPVTADAARSSRSLVV